MFCKKCEQELTRADKHCPNCGVKTGVEAKSSFKWSLNCSGIGCGVIVLLAVLLYISTITQGPFLQVMNMVVLALIIPALGSALIGVVFAISGFSTKKYTRKLKAAPKDDSTEA
jgi:uncharacterized paraquat-inducible protein A